MFMKKQKLARVSPWILAAACALLFLIIGIFAVNNYQREKKLMGEAMLQKGITIIRFVMTSSRASLRGNIRSIGFSMWQWTDHVQQAVDHAAGQPDIRFLGLIDTEGNILASSDPEFLGKKVDDSTLVFLNSLENIDSTSGKYRISSSSVHGSSSFQVASSYSPLGLKSIIPRLKKQGFDFFSSIDRLIRLHPEHRRLQAQLDDLRSGQFALLVELDVSEFNKAVKTQLLQIVSLSLVLLLVGIGGWLSLLTLQGLKGSQNRLERIQAFTDILITSLPVGLIATDSQGNIRLCNQFAETIIDLKEQDIIGLPSNNILPVELGAVLLEIDESEASPVNKEVRLVDKQNNTLTLLLAGMTVNDRDGKSAGTMLLIQDHSHLKALENEVRRNEKLAALGKMAAGVAHELRNPLSSIKGLALLLKSKFQDKSNEQRNADILVQEVERLNRSIGELLDYARPHKLIRETLNISDVVNKAISLIRMDADAVNVKILLEPSIGDILVNGDQDKLTQVFLNLLLNSTQAMPSGGELRVVTTKDKISVICRIEDTGCGLRQEFASRVFDPYFTTKSDGTGLGLAMSSKIIEEHGGKIEFQSKAGVGTIVTVKLPLLSR
jgi:two-component system, NtrC family, sensor histidine kinase HydH